VIIHDTTAICLGQLFSDVHIHRREDSPIPYSTQPSRVSCPTLQTMTQEMAAGDGFGEGLLHDQ
jgi:hypothetical protein